jgi:AcrR family transcriptional regulator
MYDPDKYKSTRTPPSQLRGKERVRTILSASLSLFKEQGVESVTTNEIVEKANIPIGSLYRYYSNKDAIITVLTDLYVDDLSKIFNDITKHPLYPLLSWHELCYMLIDSWVQHSRMSGSFAFLYAERANPRLRALNKKASERFASSFNAALTKRCALLTDRQLTAILQLAIAASELGINEAYSKETGENLHHEAIQAIALYIQSICADHDHGVVT